MEISVVMGVALLCNIMIKTNWDSFQDLKSHSTSRRNKSFKRWMSMAKIPCWEKFFVENRSSLNKSRRT